MGKVEALEVTCIVLESRTSILSIDWLNSAVPEMTAPSEYVPNGTIVVFSSTACLFGSEVKIPAERTPSSIIVSSGAVV